MIILLTVTAKINGRVKYLYFEYEVDELYKAVQKVVELKKTIKVINTHYTIKE